MCQNACTRHKVLINNLFQILSKENIEYTKSLLNKYGLKDFTNKYPSDLSGGMKQRVA